MTIAFCTTIRCKMICTRHTHLTFNTHNKWFTRTLTTDRITLRTKRTSWITIACWKQKTQQIRDEFRQSEMREYSRNVRPIVNALRPQMIFWHASGKSTGRGTVNANCLHCWVSKVFNSNGCLLNSCVSAIFGTKTIYDRDDKSIDEGLCPTIPNIPNQC
jgi:hypothetical protein